MQVDEQNAGTVGDKREEGEKREKTGKEREKKEGKEERRLVPHGDSREAVARGSLDAEKRRKEKKSRKGTKSE